MPHLIVSEDSLTRTVAAMLERCVIEPAQWTHFPAGGGKLNRATAGRLKAWGLSSGWPDYLVIFPKKNFLGFELKKENGVLSASQKLRHPKLIAAGMTIYVCRKPEQVIEWLEIEGCPMDNRWVNSILRENRNAARNASAA